jgi:hypothetical protein
MKVVQGDEVPLKRGLEYRGGMFHSRRLLEGEPGTVGNFQLSIGVSQGDFYSPRHHHNFEQIRVGLEGTLDFDRDGKMSPGVVGYFPEGVYYGPQSQSPNEVATAAVLQFGGASGSGYLSNAEVRAGMEELNKHGEFKNGVFRRRIPFHGKKNADGYQAIWEHMHQRPMVYPEPRYSKPIFMDSAHYAWVPVEGAPGVVEKLLGVFTERRSAASFLKLDPGASHSVAGHGIYLVLGGEGEIAGAPMRALTTLYLGRGETAAVTARGATEIMHFGLPNLAGVRMPERDAMPAEAAE